MHLSVADPLSTEAALVAWVGVATVVAGAALAAIIRLWPQIQELRNLAAQHEQAITRNYKAIVILDHTVQEQQPIVDLVDEHIDFLIERAKPPAEPEPGSPGNVG